MVRAIGFAWVMRVVGIVNITYCPLLAYLARKERKPLGQEERREYDAVEKPRTKYQRFWDSDETL